MTLMFKLIIIEHQNKFISYITLACNLSKISGFLLMEPFLLGSVEGKIFGVAKTPLPWLAKLAALLACVRVGVSGHPF